MGAICHPHHGGVILQVGDGNAGFIDGVAHRNGLVRRGIGQGPCGRCAVVRHQQRRRWRGVGIGRHVKSDISKDKGFNTKDVVDTIVLRRIAIGIPQGAVVADLKAAACFGIENRRDRVV